MLKIRTDWYGQYGDHDSADLPSGCYWTGTRAYFNLNTEAAYGVSASNETQGSICRGDPKVEVEGYDCEPKVVDPSDDNEDSTDADDSPTEGTEEEVTSEETATEDSEVTENDQTPSE
jgi:hypothetical protein